MAQIIREGSKTNDIKQYILNNEPCSIKEIAYTVGIFPSKMEMRLLAIEATGLLLWQDGDTVGVFRKCKLPSEPERTRNKNVYQPGQYQRYRRRSDNNYIDDV